jgi:cytochrome c553
VIRKWRLEEAFVRFVVKHQILHATINILKWTVFHNDDRENIILICQRCHNYGKTCLEELIRERENNLLRQHPELYLTALKDYMSGVRPKTNTYARKRKTYAEEGD